MEPVPETERMEEFKRSLAPAGRLSCSQQQMKLQPLETTGKQQQQQQQQRHSVEAWSSPSLPYRPRTTSPLAVSHARSSSGMALPMSRAQSMPGLGASGRGLCSPQLRPASPSGSPSRVRPLRRPVDDVFPLSSPVRASVLDVDHVRNQTVADRSDSPGTASSLTRRRRPSSPLYGFASAAAPASPSLSTLPSTPSSGASGLGLRSYDAMTVSSYGGSYMSSVPSTPTSARSRSPSISSLETIPDSPDAEEAAVEAERLARLKADADDASDGKARAAADVPARGRTMSFGPRDKRKRWSVCGAERRGDIDLETIWED
ncbi:hypothetical protein CDD80_2910 [Ophiocordyceps camponoti-rufipedis]|uniref:Basic proline-rich protein n=1 Tax=Ophiocordyceps camponoti-rufipedis TaxID=2004952 RepID=A0A2C5YPQ0_9HYPO|nr:hypothetical protein CDD80_2910 [Ophiocordyceps camponoti-rufipedis]